MDKKKEETLEEEQEGILLKLSQILPESSSQETILTREDRGKIAENERTYFETNETWIMEASAATEDNKKELIPCKTGKTKEKKGERKRGRPRNSVKKAQRGRKRGIIKSDKSGEAKEEIDSGFATSNEQLLKATEETSQKSCPEPRKPYSDKEIYFDPLPSDSEGSCKSVESVTLLQTPGIITENKRTSEFCVNIAENVKLYPSIAEDDEIMDVRRHGVDKSVQTVYTLSLNTLNEEHMKKSTDFMSSLIKLKHILSLKRDVSAKNYAEILNKSSRHSEFSNGDKCERMDVEVEEDFPGDNAALSNSKKGNIVPHETINYIVRATNAEYVMLKSVQSILECLKLGLDEDCKNLCDFWHDSASSTAVDVIIEALDSDPGFMRNKVSHFLKGIFDEISSREIAVEDSVKEYKTCFLSNFCKSFPLSFDLTGHVMEKLSKSTKSRPERKLEEIGEAKAIYFALRLLEDLLRTLLNNIREREIEEIFGRKPQEVQFKVLNLWKKCWRNPGVSNNEEDEKEKCVKYLEVVSDWCAIADRVLKFCVDEEPLLSLAAGKCSLLTREIFSKIRNAMGMRQET